MKNPMSAFEANNPLDLLGQAPPPAPALELHGSNEPQLELGWGQFHQGVAGNFAELFRRAGLSKTLLSAGFFRDVWIERRLPRRAIFAAALWHIAFVAMPFPQIPGPKNPAFANTQLTWSGQIEDFPLLEIPAAKPKTIPRVARNKSVAPEGADAFHPRQRIVTDPAHLTHPRQTLINPSAPPLAPKLLPSLPNMVQLAQSAAPARPHLEISQETLQRLRPREKHFANNSNAPAPEIAEQRTEDLALAMASSRPERPKLQINAGVAPRVSQRKQQDAADAAPEVAAQLTSPNGSAQTLIALSATPGPAAPVVPLPGNLAARVAISPEGKKSGVPGGNSDAKSNDSGNSAANAVGGSGTNSVAVSISGGAPRSASVTSGIGAGKIAMPSSRPLYTRVDADRATQEPEVQTGPPNFAALAPGAKPETIFARRRVYSMNVNMPNLNSATGSWILNFVEMRSSPTGPQIKNSDEIAEPAPLHKVDPKYPPTLMAEHVEGEVILYAVIRRDGSVDGIQVVRGIDPLLDANAVRALAQWKFRPAERQGEPVSLEAIVHSPFHAPEP
ncbi:MAG TPA: TonB family protein [Candidatus Bathyarchaeia archaeon]|nr:TonB family protein [Candidatus Bathyarchaeia archaeon]